MRRVSNFQSFRGLSLIPTCCLLGFVLQLLVSTRVVLGRENGITIDGGSSVDADNIHAFYQDDLYAHPWSKSGTRTRQRQLQQALTPIGSSTGGRGRGASVVVDERCKREVDGGMVNVKYQETSGLCVCEDGWLGPACDVCTANEACGVTNATVVSRCIDTPEVDGAVEFKTYFCQIERTSPLKSFMGSGDVWGQCDVKANMCSVSFFGGNVMQPHVQCNATNCNFGSPSDGSNGGIASSITCNTTQCGPAGGMGWPTRMPEFFRKSLEAKSSPTPTPLTITCDSVPDPRKALSLSKCTVDIEEAPLPVPLDCSFGDCITYSKTFSAGSSLPAPGAEFRDNDDRFSDVIGSGRMEPEYSDDGVRSPLYEESLKLDQQTGLTGVQDKCAPEKEDGFVHIRYSNVTDSCQCERGWKGPGCNICTGSTSCKAKRSGPDDKQNRCLENPAIFDYIKTKSYACQLEKDSPIISFLGVPDFWGDCELEKKECKVLFGGQNMTQPHVVCTATECDFSSERVIEAASNDTKKDEAYKTDINCKRATCAPSEKHGWPPTLPSFITNALGSEETAISISCEGAKEGGSTCNVKVALIPLPIDIQCKFGDCYTAPKPTNSSSNSTDGDGLVHGGAGSSSQNDDFHIPIEMIFLPIFILFVIILVGLFIIYTESKKQYLRGLFSKEMRKLMGNKKKKKGRLSMSDMSPALNSSQLYFPEHSSSNKYSEINMNIMSELSFNNVFYDVSAPQDDESWMEEGNSLSLFKSKVSKVNSNFTKFAKASFVKIMSKRRSQLDMPLDTSPTSKSIEMGDVGSEGIVHFDSAAESRESASMPNISTLMDDESPISPDIGFSPDINSPDINSPYDLEQDHIFTPGSASLMTTPEKMVPSSTENFEMHKRNPSMASNQTDKSGVISTLQRTASRVKEAVSQQFKRTKKRILHGINGSIYRGNMLAIMGPSGSGKSTLLNVIAGDHSQSAKIRGSVLIDGRRRQKWFRHITVYIPQSDELIPILTVKESVMYSSHLRLPWYYSKGRRVHKVYDVMEQLKIDHVAESRVGGSFGIRGISGGERRRVSIGMGLVADPKIMILDEPTSGLDAAAAGSIVSTLKELAQKGDGRIVIASLHQPSYQAFKELDLLLLLAKGRQIYFGPAPGVEDKFSNCGFVCPKGLNIADYILHVVSDLSCLREMINAQKEQDNLSDSAREERERAALKGSTMRMSRDGSESLKSMYESQDSRRRETLDNLWKVEMYKPFLSELNVLIKRTFKQIWRRPLLLRLQLALALITGLLSIAIFKSGMNRDIAGIQNRIGFFFFQLAFFGFAGITSTDLILEERTIFMREIQGKFFTPLAYYLSKVIVDGVMLRILPMVLYDILVYWSIGLRPGAAHFFVYLISTVLFSMATGALCLAVTMGSKTGGVASLGIILLLLFSILFGGFLSNRSSMPSWLGWLQYLSVYYHTTGVLVSNEMRGTTFYTTLGGDIQIPISADQALDTIEFAVEPNVTTYIGGLAALYVGWVVMGYIIMKVFLSKGSWRNILKKTKQE